LLKKHKEQSNPADAPILIEREPRSILEYFYFLLPQLPVSQCKYQNLKMFTLEKAKERTGSKKSTSQDNQNYCAEVQDSGEQSVNQRSDPKRDQCKQLDPTHLLHREQFKWILLRLKRLMQP